MNDKITIVFCYRDREVSRIKRSLDSLATQDDMKFQVIFIDYGSGMELANQIEMLVANYPFAKYVYNDTRWMPWNRSHALNCGIKLSETDYIFTADVDMIFRKDFVSTCNQLIHPDKAFFFSVYYLSEGSDLDKIVIKSSVEKSKRYALGLGLIPRKVLMEIGGYDEFYCYWGKEDNDIEQRLKTHGLDTLFYQVSVLMYHMHHQPVHRQRGTVPKGWLIFQDNYFNFNRINVKRNVDFNWGYIYKKDERLCLNMIYNNLTEYINIEGRIDFLRYILNKSLMTSASGQTFSVFFRDEVSSEFERSSLNRFAKTINSWFYKLNIPFKLNSVYVDNYEDIFDSRDVVAHFLASNRSLISDFAYTIKGKELKVIIRKQ